MSVLPDKRQVNLFGRTGDSRNRLAGIDSTACRLCPRGPTADQGQIPIAPLNQAGRIGDKNVEVVHGF